MICKSFMEEIIVELKITSDVLEPNMISELAGFQFDTFWTKGDFRPGTKILESNHGCCINSGLPRSASLRLQLDSLFKRISSFRGRIRGLKARCEVEVSCVIYATLQPELWFSADVVASVAALGAALDVDLYISRRDSDDAS
jgi:hypothetical protein